MIIDLRPRHSQEPGLPATALRARLGVAMRRRRFLQRGRDRFFRFHNCGPAPGVRRGAVRRL